MEDGRVLYGKTALITGATSGIGYHTALGLAQLGAAVYITGRDRGRGQEAEARLRETAGHQAVHFLQADASTVGGNQSLAERILEATGRLEILVNNVGGLYNDRTETGDGYETTLAVNLVGPFALTEALLPLLQQSAPARMINITSQGYEMWKGDLFEDVQSKKSYLGSNAYARAKLLNMLWTFALARRLEGCGVVANSVHPGLAWTTMTQSNEPRLMPPIFRLFWPVFRLLQRSGSPEKSARTSIYLASAPEAARLTGKYFESSAQPKTLKNAAVNRDNEEKAWELAASLAHNAPSAVQNRTVSLADRAEREG